jgi:sugar/nucleoside kinase (ribokinase family)
LLILSQVENSKDWNLGAWEDKINLARAAHIDSFALNFGSGVDYDLTFLKAFVAADNLGFKVVFSFNYAGNSPFMKDTVIETLRFWTPYDMYYHF